MQDLSEAIANGEGDVASNLIAKHTAELLERLNQVPTSDPTA
jgi:DNA-binding FadR family transcriptional regulator